MNLTQSVYDKLVADTALTALLETYNGEPAIFTVDPVPEDAELPYLVCAGHVSDVPFDTKDTEGREVLRDVRCYGLKDGSSILIEQIAERVRLNLHRQPLIIDGYDWVMSECTGPIKVDEPDAYGRIITLRTIAEISEGV